MAYLTSDTSKQFDTVLFFSQGIVLSFFNENIFFCKAPKSVHLILIGKTDFIDLHAIFFARFLR